MCILYTGLQFISEEKCADDFRCVQLMRLEKDFDGSDLCILLICGTMKYAICLAKLRCHKNMEDNARLSNHCRYGYLL